MSTQIEHLQQLLDGELDPMHEPTLYSELSVNGDLRTEFRDQIALKNAVQDDRMLLMPPAALTNSIFTGMGFAAPLAGAAAGAAGGSALLQWLGRLGIPVLSAITAATLTWGIAEQPTAAVNETRKEEPISRVAEQPVVPEVSTGSRDAELQRQIALLRSENARLKNQLAAQEQPATPVVPVASTNEPPVVSNEQTPNSNQELEETPLTTVHVVNDISMTNSMDMRVYGTQVINRSSMLRVYPSLMVQLRGYSLAPTVNTVASEQNDWYSNLGIALLYQVSERHSVGVEFGNESFPMVFEGDRNGQLVRYEQYPTSSWAGLTYRYTGANLGNTAFAPFGQVMAGGSKFGPVGRLAGGMQYSPLGPLTFLVGVETSALAYTFQDAWYVSPKIGLTYGMSIRF